MSWLLLSSLIWGNWTSKEKSLSGRILFLAVNLRLLIYFLEKFSNLLLVFWWEHVFKILIRKRNYLIWLIWFNFLSFKFSRYFIIYIYFLYLKIINWIKNITIISYRFIKFNIKFESKFHKSLSLLNWWPPLSNLFLYSIIIKPQEYRLKQKSTIKRP